MVEILYFSILQYDSLFWATDSRAHLYAGRIVFSTCLFSASSSWSICLDLAWRTYVTNQNNRFDHWVSWIVVVSVDGLTVQLSVIGVVLGLLTAFSWALGVVYVKKVSNEVDAYWMVCLQCLIGGGILIGTGSIFESWSAIEWNGTYLFGLGYGSTFGITLSYVIYYKLINAGEASKVGTFTFLVPIIAVFIGTVFLDEPVTYPLIIGLLLVGLSIYFVNYRGKKVSASLFNKKKAELNMEE